MMTNQDWLSCISPHEFVKEVHNIFKKSTMCADSDGYVEKWLEEEHIVERGGWLIEPYGVFDSCRATFQHKYTCAKCRDFSTISRIEMLRFKFCPVCGDIKTVNEADE